MVPPVVSLLQATCKRRHPTPPTVNCVLADAISKPSDIAAVYFKRHSVSTINSGLVFNGKASQVIYGVS